MRAGVLIARENGRVVVSIDPARLGPIGDDGRHEVALEGYEVMYASRALHEEMVALVLDRGPSGRD